MGKFSPTTLNGDCEEIANPSTAFGRRRRNWIDAKFGLFLSCTPAGHLPFTSKPVIRVHSHVHNTYTNLTFTTAIRFLKSFRQILV
jgi:hypothetical protein